MSNQPVRGFVQVAAGRVIPAALQAIFYLVFAYILEPESYGQLSYLISIAGVASVISRFGLPYSITVYSAKKNFLFVNQANIILLIIGSVTAIILLVVDPFVALLSFALTIFATNQHNLLGLKKYQKFMTNAIIKSVLLISITILLYFYLDLSGILLGMAISNLVISYDFIKSINKKFNSFENFKANFKVIVHNFGTDASTTLPRLADKLVIVPVIGLAYTGIYQFNLQILFALEILPLALHSFLLPEESSGKKYQKISYFILIATSIIVLVVILVSPFIINQLFPKYSDGVFGLQIMSISLIPLSLTAIFNARLQGSESTKIGYSAIVRLGTLLPLLVILGESFGLVGLSFAVLISAICYASFLGFLYYKEK